MGSHISLVGEVTLTTDDSSRPGEGDRPHVTETRPRLYGADSSGEILQQWRGKPYAATPRSDDGLQAVKSPSSGTIMMRSLRRKPRLTTPAAAVIRRYERSGFTGRKGA